MKQTETDYTNFLPLFHDLRLDTDYDLLYFMHHNGKDLEKLKQQPNWQNSKNIFLIDSENAWAQDLSWQNDSRIKCGLHAKLTLKGLIRTIFGLTGCKRSKLVFAIKTNCR